MLLRHIKLFIGIILIAALSSWIINAYIEVKSKPYIINNISNVPKVDAVLVPGASVYRSGKLSPALKSRVELGIHFIFFKDSTPILFSGHSIPNGYNEPAAMAGFARQRLIPDHLIIQDSSGSSTYTSIMHCKTKYDFRSIIIVTQAYHLPRAVYIAKSIGLRAYGLPAPGNISKFTIREFFSRVKDFLLLEFFKIFHTNEIFSI